MQQEERFTVDLLDVLLIAGVVWFVILVPNLEWWA